MPSAMYMPVLLLIALLAASTTAMVGRVEPAVLRKFEQQKLQVMASLAHPSLQDDEPGTTAVLRVSEDRLHVESIRRPQDLVDGDGELLAKTPVPRQYIDLFAAADDVDDDDGDVGGGGSGARRALRASGELPSPLPLLPEISASEAQLAHLRLLAGRGFEMDVCASITCKDGDDSHCMSEIKLKLKYGVINFEVKCSKCLMGNCTE